MTLKASFFERVKKMENKIQETMELYDSLKNCGMTMKKRKVVTEE